MIEDARRYGWDLLKEWTGRTGDATLLVTGYAIASSDEPVIRVAGAGHHESGVCQANSLSGVIPCLVEVRHVVRHRVHRLHVLVTNTDLQAQLRSDFPGILHKR